MRRIASLLFVVLFLSGCMGSSPARYASNSNSSSGGSGGIIEVANETGQSIFYFYASSCSSDSWGEDQLGGSEVISSGSRKRFTISAGCWDFRAKMRDGKQVERRNIRIASGDAKVWTVYNSN